MVLRAAASLRLAMAAQTGRRGGPGAWVGQTRWAGWRADGSCASGGRRERPPRSRRCCWGPARPCRCLGHRQRAVGVAWQAQAAPLTTRRAARPTPARPDCAAAAAIQGAPGNRGGAKWLVKAWVAHLTLDRVGASAGEGRMRGVYMSPVSPRCSAVILSQPVFPTAVAANARCT